jgi:hypothetical protein
VSLDNARVAPSRGVPVKDKPWEGTLARKPWDYPITAAIVHRDTSGWLAAAIDLLRAQTVRPYILVIDTGSEPEAQEELAELDQVDDVEVHYIRSKAYRGSSQPVAVAMDVAFALCQTEFLFSTHTDVFPTRPDLIETTLEPCSQRLPVVGWQMSERKGWPVELWKRTPSHTATCYHMPTMRELRVLWNMTLAAEVLGLKPGEIRGGFPDTESMLGLILAAHGITRRNYDEPDDGGRHWLCLGPEPNEPYETAYFRHYRSAGSAVVYWRNDLITALRIEQIRQEIEAIPARLEQWKMNGN